MSDGTPSRRDDETGDGARPTESSATSPATSRSSDAGSRGTGSTDTGSTDADSRTLDARSAEANAPADAAAEVAPDGRTKRVRPVRVWDLVLSIVLVLLLIGVAITGVFIGSLFALGAPSCVNGSCALFDVGLNVAIWGPIVVGVLGLAVTVTLLVLRKRAFWVPLAGIALVAIVVFVGGAIALVAGSGG
ncbi:hypothetical protein [Agromyces mangrovi Wang et al. 2018]|uniref:hypothetical protein n=1 Tax=Agromyces mangrovi TaxID=1858653 RepID=UPI00257488D0|nr:hypothetical protein [Agromyces mangrovi]BDZ65592.1 hypothetical protein GCM10025877_25300 [Agromyces mangrovi]